MIQTILEDGRKNNPYYWAYGYALAIMALLFNVWPLMLLGAFALIVAIFTVPDEPMPETIEENHEKV